MLKEICLSKKQNFILQLKYESHTVSQNGQLIKEKLKDENLNY